MAPTHRMSSANVYFLRALRLQTFRTHTEGNKNLGSQNVVGPLCLHFLSQRVLQGAVIGTFSDRVIMPPLCSNNTGISKNTYYYRSVWNS